MLLSCYYESNNFQKVKKKHPLILSLRLFFWNADKVNLISLWLCNHEQLLDRPHVHNTNDNKLQMVIVSVWLASR